MNLSEKRKTGLFLFDSISHSFSDFNIYFCIYIYIYDNCFIYPKERDLRYTELIKLWSSYKERTELLYKLLMEIEAALNGLLIMILGLRIRQILKNDANNIVSLFGTDINECVLDACGSNSICTNTQGSYNCKCKPGFQSTSGGGKDCSGGTVEMGWCFFLKLCCPPK